MRKSALSYCEENISLDGRPFRRADWPELVDILDTIDRREGCTFLILGDIQSFKTLAATLWMLSSIELRPARSAFYFPVAEDTDDYANKKFNPLFDTTPSCQRPLSRRRHDNKITDKAFAHMPLSMYSANTKGDRQSKTLCHLVTDEPWQFAPGQLTEIAGRYTASIRDALYRHIAPTSAPDAGSEIDEKWRDSDQRHWEIACPACGEYHYPDFYPPPPISSPDPATGLAAITQPPGGVRYDSGDQVRDDEGRLRIRAFYETVRYQCPLCGELSRKLEGKKGRWRAHNPDACDPRIVGWKHNASASLPLPELALIKVRADEALAHGESQELEDFDRKRAVRPWSLARIVSSDSRPIASGDYPLRAEWDREHIRQLLIDVQQDHYYWLIRLVASDTSSRLYDLGIAYSEAQLVDIQRAANVSGHGGHIQQDVDTGVIVFGQPCHVYIDGNYNTPQVRRLAARNHWCVLRGEDGVRRYRHADGRYRIWNPITVMDSFEGVAREQLPGRADQVVAEVRFAKNDSRNVLRTLQGISDPAPVWTYAAEAEKARPEYLKHLSAWVPMDKRRRKGSEETYTEWIKRHKRDDWEWCEVASVVGASMSGLIGSDAVSSAEETEDQDTEKQ